MKIRFATNMNVVGSDDNISYQAGYTDLSLCGQGLQEGNATGLLPIKLPNGAVVTPQLSITSGTTKSRRGVTSAVIKVSLPYTALSDDGNGAVVVDPKRSNGYISAHIVVALPQSAVQDFKASQPAIAKSAYAQVAIVSQLLRACLSHGLMERFATNLPVELDDPSYDVVLAPLKVFGANPEVKDGDMEGLSIQDNLPLVKPSIGSTGSAGFDASGVTVPSTLDNFLIRVVNGLAPLSCADIIMPLTYHS